MNALAEPPLDQHMAKEDAKKKSDQTPTVTVRMDAELVELAHIICTHTAGRNGKRLKMVDYLDSLVRQRIIADHAAVMRRITDEQAGGKKRRGVKDDKGGVE